VGADHQENRRVRRLILRSKGTRRRRRSRFGIIACVAGILALWFAANWGYQVIRKPAELFFPVSGALSKTPPETWRQYEPIFRGHSTAVMTPAFLAALAQVYRWNVPRSAALLHPRSCRG